MNWTLLAVALLLIVCVALVAAAAFLVVVAEGFKSDAEENLLLERDAMRAQYREEIKSTTERIEQSAQIARHFADAAKEERMGKSLESRVDALEAKFDAYARASGIDVDALVADEEAARARGFDSLASPEAIAADEAEAAAEEAAAAADEAEEAAREAAAAEEEASKETEPA